MSLLTATTFPNAPDFAASTMNTSVDYQTRRRLQNRVAQQRFREKSKKQIHSDAARTGCYSSPALSTSPLRAQMGHISGSDTIATWPQTSLPLLTPTPLESQDVSQRSFNLEAIPMGQFTPLPPIDRASNSHDSEPCLYTPPLTEICFDFESLPCSTPLELDMSISQAHEPSEEPDVENPMSSTYSETRNLLLDGTEDIIQARLTDYQDQSSPENKIQINDKAASILQKQKIHLGRQADELIRKLISIYDLGVSLEIFPGDPYFKQVLETADTRFSSIWK
ncbi:bZIP transcription factor [Aspergillus mulundensis]|uniref:BZIP domain-containing protein n=1 Tax=Aspergillus mulundensis TaxID=1810919 RepID=A0A3D8S5E4_9EURO|nr:hypothetical protein DSM5745_05084 [Aspergillus mulundensis]RDW81527.1 hypothetical protein DSM5745_05084 [Aspergillus mulundensis]